MEVGIGVDMGGTKIKIGLVSGGKLVESTHTEALAHETLAERLTEIGNGVDRLLQKHGSKPSGIGIAFPGIVDSDRMKILSRYVKYPDAQEVNLPGWAMERWGIPLVLENDARAALVGEWQYGAGKGCDNLVLITLGTGVGSAVLVNGKLLKGKHYLAGNLGGHMSINLHGDTCNCGATGCLETEGSTWALDRHVKQAPDYLTSALFLDKEINFNVLFTRARQGDKLAMGLTDNCLKAWAAGMINLILAYDPERVVIGGGIMKSKDIIIPYLNEMIKKHPWLTGSEVQLAAAEQVDSAGIVGMYHLITRLNQEQKPVV
jgi:glucokinase